MRIGVHRRSSAVPSGFELTKGKFIMMFTCTRSCTDPAHRHRPSLLLRTGSIKTASKAKARPAPSPKVVRDRKGRSLRIDLHCHYQNPAIAEKVAHLNASQFEPSGIFANALTKEVNVKQ